MPVSKFERWKDARFRIIAGVSEMPTPAFAPPDSLPYLERVLALPITASEAEKTTAAESLKGEFQATGEEGLAWSLICRTNSLLDHAPEIFNRIGLGSYTQVLSAALDGIDRALDGYYSESGRPLLVPFMHCLDSLRGVWPDFTLDPERTEVLDPQGNVLPLPSAPEKMAVGERVHAIVTSHGDLFGSGVAAAVPFLRQLAEDNTLSEEERTRASGWIESIRSQAGSAFEAEITGYWADPRDSFTDFAHILANPLFQESLFLGDEAYWQMLNSALEYLHFVIKGPEPYEEKETGDFLTFSNLISALWPDIVPGQEELEIAAGGGTLTYQVGASQVVRESQSIISQNEWAKTTAGRLLDLVEASGAERRLSLDIYGVGHIAQALSTWAEDIGDGAIATRANHWVEVSTSYPEQIIDRVAALSANGNAVDLITYLNHLVTSDPSLFWHFFQNPHQRKKLLKASFAGLRSCLQAQKPEVFTGKGYRRFSEERLGSIGYNKDISEAAQTDAKTALLTYWELRSFFERLVRMDINSAYIELLLPALCDFAEVVGQAGLDAIPEMIVEQLGTQLDLSRLDETPQDPLRTRIIEMAAQTVADAGGVWGFDKNECQRKVRAIFRGNASLTDAWVDQISAKAEEI